MERKRRAYKTGNDFGWEALANAIVLRAVEDYKKALKGIANHTISPRGDNMSSNSRIIELNQFFHSNYFALLTDADPDGIIEGIQKRVRQGRL